MTDAMELAVVGAGHIGTVHLQSADAMDGVTVAGVADPKDANRDRAERLTGCRTYEEYERLFAVEDIDIAVIAVPPFLHLDAATAAIEAGCHLFVEKPLGRTTAEAEAIVERADRAGVSLGVDHTVRYQPEIREMKTKYDAGELGHVPMATIRRINDGPFDSPPAGETASGWHVNPTATGGGALMDLGVHLFDTLRWFFGDLTVEHAELDRQLDLPYEDTATVVTTNGDGTTAVLNCGFFQWERPPDVNMDFRLDGITDTLHSDSFVPDRFLTYAARTAAENVVKRSVGADPEYFGPSYYYRAHHDALTAFCRAVRRGEDPPVDGTDGLRAVELVRSAYEMADDADWFDDVDDATRPLRSGPL